MAEQEDWIAIGRELLHCDPAKSLPTYLRAKLRTYYQIISLCQDAEEFAPFVTLSCEESDEIFPRFAPFTNNRAFYTLLTLVDRFHSLDRQPALELVMSIVFDHRAWEVMHGGESPKRESYEAIDVAGYLAEFEQIEKEISGPPATRKPVPQTPNKTAAARSASTTPSRKRD